MNKRIAIIIGIILLVALGVGATVLSQRSPEPSSTATENTLQTETAEKSLKDLLSSQTSQKCSFQDEVGNSGNVYIASGKMKGDFVTSSPQGSVNSHMIMDGSTSYFWMDGQSTGFKMTIDPNDIEIPENADQSNVNLDQKYNYDCQNWSTDATVFTLPTSVTFSDFGQLGVPTSSGTGTPKVDCSVCDQAPESSRAACRQALKCS